MTPARRIVVVGSGGREHALAARLVKDPVPAIVFILPGNDAIARQFACRPVDVNDVEALAAACAREAPDLVVVGPEAPLAAGLADRLAARGVAVFGPTAAAAGLESSKAFAKDVMRAAGVATPDAEVFDASAACVAALARFGPPWVLKADGLAAGKGVCVTSDRSEAESFARAALDGGRFGAAGRKLLLERFVAGEEISAMALCDGTRALMLPAARDFKRAYDGDAGPNTGGMGAYAPSAALDAAGAEFVRARIMEPVLAELARRGTPYRGALYAGLVRTAHGLEVIEFNCRFGDPETQVVMPRIGGSLVELLEAAATGSLEGRRVETGPGFNVAVALVGESYPEPAAAPGLITGTNRVHGDAWMVYAGVAQSPGGWQVTGGRAAYVCAHGATLDEARERAYAAIGRLGGVGWRFRRDIGTMTPASLTG